mmetsp:Transcript_38794/g.101424  ORF Transcript_38794/g.101424 Transcript_38794/m.101424 type:complete len:938 (+) Transcript_38794:72-2885(+)
MDDLEHAEVLQRLRIHESSLAHKSETIENRLRMLQQARQHRFEALSESQVRAPLATVMPLSSLLKFQMDARRDEDSRGATPDEAYRIAVGTNSAWQPAGALSSETALAEADGAGDGGCHGVGEPGTSQNLPRSGAGCSVDRGEGGRRLASRGPRTDARAGRRLRLAPTSRVAARSSSPRPAPLVGEGEATGPVEDPVQPPEAAPPIDDPAAASSWFSMPWNKHRSHAKHTESGAGTAVRPGDSSGQREAIPGPGGEAQLWTPRSTASQPVSSMGIASPAHGHQQQPTAAQPGPPQRTPTHTQADLAPHGVPGSNVASPSQSQPEHCATERPAPPPAAASGRPFVHLDLATARAAACARRAADAEHAAAQAALANRVAVATRSPDLEDCVASQSSSGTATVSWAAPVAFAPTPTTATPRTSAGWHTEQEDCVTPCRDGRLDSGDHTLRVSSTAGRPPLYPRPTARAGTSNGSSAAGVTGFGGDVGRPLHRQEVTCDSELTVAYRPWSTQDVFTQGVTEPAGGMWASPRVTPRSSPGAGVVTTGDVDHASNPQSTRTDRGAPSDSFIASRPRSRPGSGSYTPPSAGRVERRSPMGAAEAARRHRAAGDSLIARGRMHAAKVQHTPRERPEVEVSGTDERSRWYPGSSPAASTAVPPAQRAGQEWTGAETPRSVRGFSPRTADAGWGEEWDGPGPSYQEAARAALLSPRFDSLFRNAGSQCQSLVGSTSSSIRDSSSSKPQAGQRPPWRGVFDGGAPAARSRLVPSDRAAVHYTGCPAVVPEGQTCPRTNDSHRASPRTSREGTPVSRGVGWSELQGALLSQDAEIFCTPRRDRDSGIRGSRAKRESGTAGEVYSKFANTLRGGGHSRSPRLPRQGAPNPGGSTVTPSACERRALERQARKNGSRSGATDRNTETGFANQVADGAYLRSWQHYDVGDTRH